MEGKRTSTYCVECCAIVQLVHRVVQTLSMGLSVQCRNIELGCSDQLEVVAHVGSASRREICFAGDHVR